MNNLQKFTPFLRHVRFAGTATPRDKKDNSTKFDFGIYHV